ncbi:NACHT domain protein [Sphingobium sp. RAC03]|nr:NACHT domain protein [Sphingobium sp. RAC03]
MALPGLAMFCKLRQYTIVSEIILNRKLWYAGPRERVSVDQDFLRTDPRPLIVLGEAGMGKSTLLDQLSGIDGFAVMTARRLVNLPVLPEEISQGSTLVIDALDELSAGRDGDAVDLVLRHLGPLNFPRFILSCRVAEWRSATALQGIRDFYAETPVELHLEPFERWDAIELLIARVGTKQAEAVISHLETLGLGGLWANPQTLELVARVAADGRLPDSKGELFAAATRLLAPEHREEKAASKLASLSEVEVLNAAGAGLGALILTGQEALSTKVNPGAIDLPLRELGKLDGAAHLADALDSRLFASRGIQRFSYAHRAIGEFLGARWLAQSADSPRKKRRILELFNGHALVPASLRGTHAWLAWHSSALANEIIAADPMGIIEYGDADGLAPEQARVLLEALEKLSSDDPAFRTWADYRPTGLAHPALFPELCRIIDDRDAEFGLQFLILQALKGAPHDNALDKMLVSLLLDQGRNFALRSEAGNRLVERQVALDWQKTIVQLRAEASDDGVRLAIELMDELGFGNFHDELLVDIVLAQLERAERTAGVYHGLIKKLPTERLHRMLDGVAEGAQKLGNRHERRSNSSVTDLAFGLLARALNETDVAAERLWTWLQRFDGETGYQREYRQEVSDALRKQDGLRRAVQRLVILEQPGEKTAWQRAWRLSERSRGLAPNDDDVILLIGLLEADDDRWRDIVQLAQHNATAGEKVRCAAERFTTDDPEAAAWLMALSKPRMAKWEIEQAERSAKRELKRQAEHEGHRANFFRHIAEMRAGDYGMVVNPAKAYLNLFHDIGEKGSNGPGRIEEWLGPELRDACLEGFEAFLQLIPVMPDAAEIAKSHAEGRRWDAAYIIVVALAERVRTGRGLLDLPDERLMAGLFEIRFTQIDDHAGFPELEAILASELRQRGIWEMVQREYFQPQFDHKRTQVHGLYSLVRSDDDAALSEKLAREWLESIPDMPEGPEFELIDRLLTSEDDRAFLQALARDRLAKGGLNEERRHSWEAVGLIIDFEAMRAELESRGSIERELLWHLRARLGNRYGGVGRAALGADQLGWAIARFRRLWPVRQRPSTVTTGDTNPWDATEYVNSLINRLGGHTDDAAIALLSLLRDEDPDGYTFHLRVAAADQRRRRVEADWQPPTLPTVASAIRDIAPTTPEQLQAILIQALRDAQKLLTGSDVDWYDDFYRGNTPQLEEKSRDTVLKMIRPLPFGIEALPEGHLADDKRVDILCLINGVMVPIEIKGQWNADLWTAADRQLDLLYTNDSRAERGIYLVLWYGTASNRPPKKPPAGIPTPQSAAELEDALAAQSLTTRQGRTEVVVLDLTRPT